jgi:hypothetical protein
VAVADTRAVISNRATSLSICVHCARDFVAPVSFEPVGRDRWWMFLRCGQCGVSREVTVSNAEAERYDDELIGATRTIRNAAEEAERSRFAAETDAFGAALRHGAIDAADFAR